MTARARIVPATRLALVLVALLGGAVTILPPRAFAQSPSPSVVPGGDTRSSGEGAGFVGSPAMIALGVLALGAGTALLTVIVVRLTRSE